VRVKDDDWQLIAGLTVGGAIILIPLIIVTGLFILTPLAVIFVAIAFMKWLKRRLVPTPELHAQIQSVFPDAEAFRDNLIDRMLDLFAGNYPAMPLLDRMVGVGVGLYDGENLLVRPLLLHRQGSIEEAQYRDALLDYQRKSADPQRTMEVFYRTVCGAFQSFHAHLSPLAHIKELTRGEAEPLFTVSVRDVIDDEADAVSDIAAPFFDPLATEVSVFRDLRRQLQDNQWNASTGSKNMLAPQQYKGRQDVVDAYLGGTPLAALFDGEVPWQLPDQTRFSGHWVIAPQGKGKTTLLTAMLAEDLGKDAAIIIIDGKGDLIAEVQNLAAYADRYVVIDPRHTGINPLDVDKANIPQAAERLEYVFSALLEAKITPLQTVLFRNVFRALVSAFDKPNLATLQDLLLNGWEKHKDQIETLRSDLRDFFVKQYNRETYVTRRNEVLSRVDLLMSNDHIRNMLLRPGRPFDIGKEMDAGKIILIDNSMALLGEQGAEFIGRYFLSEIWAAATARSGRTYKKPCYVYIDEAHRVIHRDEKVSAIIDDCRSQKIALILAHQRTDQITVPSVLTALGNCAIRYANSDEEARMLAPRMRTTPQFLQSLHVGEFAALVRDMTPAAVRIHVRPADFSHSPRIKAVQHMPQEVVPEPKALVPEPVATAAAPPPPEQKPKSAPKPPLARRHDDGAEGSSDWG
jgi:hypothetical protein